MHSPPPLRRDDDAPRALFPDARYVILASRLVPGLDGGFTVATLARARHMAQAGVEDGRGPLLLTVDPGETEDHAAHRAAFASSGAIGAAETLRNLFDELREDPSWLYAAASPGGTIDEARSRPIFDAAGTRVATIPVIDDPEWYLTDAPVVVHGLGGDRHVRGFCGLYIAWLDHVIEQLAADDARPVVVVCEARQLGVLLGDWTNPRARLVHTVHTSHLETPYTPDAPVNALWQRWFDRLGDFDAVLWPTRQQLDDVTQRFGERTIGAVVPSAAPFPAVDSSLTGSAATDSPADAGPRAVLLTRLVPVKRLDHAIRAWARVVEAVPDARLDIYGDGPLRAKLEQLIAELGLTGRVVLRGRSEDSPYVFDGAALTLQTSAYEGQGLAPLEAMSRGCPVVAYDVRYGARDRAAIGGEVLVGDGDVEALADEAIRLLCDDAWHAELAVGALACARAFSPARTMSAMATAIAEVLASAPRRTGTVRPGTA